MIRIKGGPVGHDFTITTEDGTVIPGVHDLVVSVRPNELVEARLSVFVDEFDFTAMPDGITIVEKDAE